MAGFDHFVPIFDLDRPYESLASLMPQEHFSEILIILNFHSEFVVNVQPSVGYGFWQNTVESLHPIFSHQILICDLNFVRDMEMLLQCAQFNFSWNFAQILVQNFRIFCQIFITFLTKNSTWRLSNHAWAYFHALKLLFLC